MPTPEAEEYQPLCQHKVTPGRGKGEASMPLKLALAQLTGPEKLEFVFRFGTVVPHIPKGHKSFLIQAPLHASSIRFC